MSESKKQARLTPALPCPSWCAQTHGHGDPVWGHQVLRYFGGTTQEGWVALHMADYGTDPVGSDPALATRTGRVSVRIYWAATCRTASRELDRAGELADMATALGRPDVAGLVRELIRLGEGG